MVRFKRIYSLRNIILISLISLFCGVIFLGVGYIRDDILIPISLALSTHNFNFYPVANAIPQGPWILAATLIGTIFRAPGTAVLGQAVGSVVECFTGGVAGVWGMLGGILEGFGADLGFACSKYRHYNILTFVLISFFMDIITFWWDYISDGYYKFSLINLLVAFIIQFLSIFLVSNYLGRKIYVLIKRSHVLEGSH